MSHRAHHGPPSDVYAGCVTCPSCGTEVKVAYSRPVLRGTGTTAAQLSEAVKSSYISWNGAHSIFENLVCGYDRSIIGQQIKERDAHLAKLTIANERVKEVLASMDTRPTPELFTGLVEENDIGSKFVGTQHEIYEAVFGHVDWPATDLGPDEHTADEVSGGVE